MKLVDEIIEMSSDGKRSLSDALRKCLVLAFELKNEKLKYWIEKELNGFNTGDDIPEYRKVLLHSKGNFSGPMGAWIPQRPLPVSIIDKKHRDMLTSKLAQPIAAYEGSAQKKGQPVINWPPELIVHYQDKFIPGYALSQAWQELPTTLLVGLCEEVRNRLLRFALEIREELGQVDDKPAEVPSSKIEAAVINHIYGGTNIIAGSASNFAQIVSVQVDKDDFSSLAGALAKLDVAENDINALRSAIEGDGKTFGSRTKQWLASVGGKIGNAGVKLGIEVATGFVKVWLRKYFGGIDPGDLGI
jgi:hypothetical protein